MVTPSLRDRAEEMAKDLEVDARARRDMADTIASMGRASTAAAHRKYADGLDRDAALIRELLAAQEWRPISEAPKDGTVIQLYLSKKPVCRQWIVPEEANHYAIGFWDHRAWRSVETEDCGTMGGEMTGWMADWVCIDVEPTHWKPLDTPNPPPQEQE